MNDRDLAERLAKLQGVDPRRYSLPPITVYHEPTRKTHVEQTEDLLNELMDEVKLDETTSRLSKRKNVSSVQEIESRLAKLRGYPLESMSVPPAEFMDSDEESEKIIEKLCAESALPLIPSPAPRADGYCNDKDEINISHNTGKVLDNEDDNGTDDEEDDDSGDYDEEDPFCVICTENGILSCKNCDYDLYCEKCFREFHADPETRKHRVLRKSENRTKH